MGAAFEFTPAGIRPLALDGEAVPPVAPATPATVAVTKQPAKVSLPADFAERAAETYEANRKEPADRKPLKRREYRKELRARLKQVQREIKALRSLEDEEAELKRLIAALNQPAGTVRSINSARKSG
ncbi:MAG TPA: hypothetical protein VGK73_11310 [Polyangiaceae bacterium]